MNIGIFDSGLGGLSILREIFKELPLYNYIYLGDNARVPYGNRSSEVIYDFTCKAVDFLFKKNCKLIILACNTASAGALRKIQHEYLPKNYPDNRVLGIIRPVVETAIENHTNKVGVIGTRATIDSKSFIAEFKKSAPRVLVFQNPAPLLVPLVEEAEVNWIGLNMILKKYLDPLVSKKIDSLILGCTHYGLIHNKIQKTVGQKIKVISQGKATAVKLKDYLHRHPEINRHLAKKGKHTYYVTDLTNQFIKMTKLFMGNHINNGEKLQLVHL